MLTTWTEASVQLFSRQKGKCRIQVEFAAINCTTTLATLDGQGALVGCGDRQHGASGQSMGESRSTTGIFSGRSHRPEKPK